MWIKIDPVTMILELWWRIIPSKVMMTQTGPYNPYDMPLVTSLIERNQCEFDS